MPNVPVCYKAPTFLTRFHHKHLKGSQSESCSFLRFVLTVRMLNILRKNQHDEMLICLAKKLWRLISKELGINEHITNVYPYCFSFLEKLIIRRGMKFCLPQ